MRLRGWVTAALMAVFAVSSANAAQGRPLTVEDLYSPLTLGSPTLSPDGNRLVVATEYKQGDEDYTQVRTFHITADGGLVEDSAFDYPEAINWVRWANNQRLILSSISERRLDRGYLLYVDENGQIERSQTFNMSYLVAVDPDGANSVVMFLGERGRMSMHQTRLDRVVDVLPNDPDHILMQVRSQRRGALNVYRVNIHTGQPQRVDRGLEATAAWFSNGAGETVMRLDFVRGYRDLAVLIREGDGRRWRRVAQQSTFEFSELQEGIQWVGRTTQNNRALVRAPDPATGILGLFSYDLDHGELGEPLLSRPDYDVGALLMDPITLFPLAAVWSDERPNVVSLDPQIAPHLEAIQAYVGEDAAVYPIQVAGDHMLLRVLGPQQPSAIYLYRFSATDLQPLGMSQAVLAEVNLAPVETHRYAARDGQELFGYVTRPQTHREGGPALIVLPHGGPEVRDEYTFDHFAQLLAAEGFTVFQPQFRGSFGFGRSFTEVGHGEWGGLIQNDITDGTRSIMAAEGIESDRVCIAGWSFGGYSAFMQAILEPDLYQCAVAGAAVSDLPDLLVWKETLIDNRFEYLRRMMGADDEARMRAHSPTEHADDITIPLMIIHPRDDRIVPIDQARLMIEALQAANTGYEYITFQGGHHLTDAEQMEAFIGNTARFVSRHIDGATDRSE